MVEVILDDCDPRQCVSTRRDVDSGGLEPGQLRRDGAEEGRADLARHTLQLTVKMSQRKF